MSMSQEEIESLMNGLDFEEESSSPEPVVEEEPKEETSNEGSMSEDDINELIAQTEDIVSSNDNGSSEESVDELLNSLENMDIDEPSEEETNIDDIIKELEETSDITQEESKSTVEEEVIEEPVTETNEEVEEKLSTDNIDDLLASIDGIEEETQLEEPSPVAIIENKDNDIIDIDRKINSGVFPLPVEDDTKVVNQLSEVANDSEEKATKIFDVLSNILDYNNDIQNDIQALSEFNEKQISMLNSLNQKFPNIEVFKMNLEQAQVMGTHIEDVNEKLNDGNTEIFQAMELMQYHDINRQKIERVMSVIRKLSTYLNNLFEDEGNRQEVAVANHIHGDNTEDLVGDDDLEALIAEFNK